jgi:hypothetical protein
MKMQRTTNKFIFKKVLVNPFMADGDSQILLHPTAYLFWTPLFAKQLFYIGPGTAIYTRTNFSLVSLFCKCISLFGAIAPTTPISFKFSTYCRFVNANYFRSFRLCASFLSVGKRRAYSGSAFFTTNL